MTVTSPYVKCGVSKFYNNKVKKRNVIYLIPVSQAIKNEMEEMNLLKPEPIRDGNGNVIWYKEEGSRTFKKSLSKKVHIASKNKKSKGKSYFVEEPVYKKYLKLKASKKQ